MFATPFIYLTLLLTVGPAHASALRQVSLQTKAPGNEFAKCMMEVANRELVHSAGSLDLLNSATEAYDANEAAVWFYVREPRHRSAILRIALRTTHRSGWQMRTSASGERFAYTESANSEARLIFDEEREVGRFDVAECARL